MNAFPVPGTGEPEVVVPAPVPREGYWAGAPSAALDVDGSVVLAYRVRMADARGVAIIVARLADGVRRTAVAGLDWTWHGTVLAGRPGTWDARGARVTAVLPDGRAAYDGRASAEENFSERTGLAEPANGRLRPQDAGPVAAVRYLDVLPLQNGGYRLYYEAPLPDGSHELRTELVTYTR